MKEKKPSGTKEKEYMRSPIIVWIVDFNLRTGRHSRNQASVRDAKMVESPLLFSGLRLKVISSAAFGRI